MYISELLAIASAFCIALSSMLLGELRGRVPLLQLARWQMLAAFTMTGLLSVVLGGWHTIAAWQFWLLAASGFAGIGIANITYLAAIYSVGPRITALLFSLTSPIALVLGYLVLGETISVRQGLGIVTVLCGVVLAIGLPGSPGTSRQGLSAVPVAAPTTMLVSVAALATLNWRGIVFGVVTAFGQALGTLLARPAMASGVEPFTAMALRSGTAALFFMALAFFRFGRGSPSAVRPTMVGVALGSAFLGTVVGMSLLMAALHRGDIGIVSTLSSITPVMILPMVWIRTGKVPSTLAWLGAFLTMIGTAFISI